MECLPLPHHTVAGSCFQLQCSRSHASNSNVRVQAKGVGQAAPIGQPASAAAAAEDQQQLMYQVEWQVRQARVAQALIAGPSLIRRRVQHEMVWSASSPAAVQQRAGILCASGMGLAAAASRATARQAQVLQHIMGTPGGPGTARHGGPVL